MHSPKRHLYLLFLLSLMLSSCADEDFFQGDARIDRTAPPDSVWVTAGRHYNSGWLHRLFWGDHHRKLWAEPVKVPVLNMKTLHGGLYFSEKGGGYQSTSFELKDSLGRQYALRSIDKDPVHVLYDFWQKTFVTNILRDQTSAANPYGALVVPGLAKAVGVHHSNPALYYVSPTDTSFGEYNKLAQGRLFLLEEKYKTEADITQPLAHARDLESSDDVLHLRYSYNTYHFDQKAFARARLLDLLVGDWDRHKGQWDWALVKKGTETYFEPIPKDRDQVFLKMDDGIIPFIATSKFMARKFQSFNHKFSDVRALMINAKFVDERLLNELTSEDWKQIAESMQASLTDEVIEAAVRRLPPPIYSLKGKDLVTNLKSRRDQLSEAAQKMYEILAKEVTIAGSDKKENFIVKRLDDERTEVTVTRPADDGLPEKQLYHRIFYRKETSRIVLHGLAGNDTFELEGDVQEGILIQVYGGLGEDKITERSTVKGWKKMTEIYDTERGNEIDFGTEAKDQTTRDVRVHAYDREGN